MEQGETAEKPHKLTRRDMLVKGAIGLTAVSSTIAASVDLRDMSARPESRKVRSHQVSPEGYRIGFVGGVHGNGDGSEPVTTLEVEDLYQPAGALFIEDVGLPYVDTSEETLALAISAWLDDVRGMGKEPLEFARKEGIPLLFGDYIEKKQGIKVIGTIIHAFEGAGVGSALQTHVKDIWKGHKMNRRSFAKALGVAGAAAGVHVFSGSMVNLAERLGIVPDSPAWRDMKTVAADLVHPENSIIVMRNIVWALKSTDYFRKGIIKKDSALNIIGGGGHRFVDYFVRYPDIARRYWKLFGYTKLASTYSGDDPRWVNHSFVYYPDTKSGELIHHELLDDLIA